MTTGIYALYWEEQDLIYIGLSQNIRTRFTEHVYKMKHSTHTNYKVQNTFNSYGEPKLIIIEECSIDELNDREIYWTKEFDSINSGLNIIEAGQVGFGTNSNASKYSKRTILKAFSFLYKTTLSYKQIAIKLGINKALLHDISSCRSHLWLRDEYPDKYAKISLNKALRIVDSKRSGKSAKDRGIVYPIVVSPSGIEFSIENAKDFSIENNLDYSNLHKLLKNKRKSCKGWRLKD